VFDQDGSQVVADSKGFRTEAYKLKKRLMEAFHAVKIREL
jgi:hypothetical protein